MAEVNRPGDGSDERARPVDGNDAEAGEGRVIRPATAASGATASVPERLDDRSDEAERIDAPADADRTGRIDAAPTERLEADRTERIDAEPTERLEADRTERIDAAPTERLGARDADAPETARGADDAPTTPYAAERREGRADAEERDAGARPAAAVAAPASERPAPPAAPAAATAAPLAPAAEDAPPAPRKRGNRLVGTAWVLLAAGLFQALYFGALALIILLLGGAAAVAPGLTNIARFPFAWLPVLFFFLLFELTVLLFNRAGRFAYVVGSLVVGFLVYVLSVLLISIMVGGGIGDTATLARAFESPEFLLTGLVAREVMLWTGFAIGARGSRVRRRNRAARQHYDEELADARA